MKALALALIFGILSGLAIEASAKVVTLKEKGKTIIDFDFSPKSLSDDQIPDDVQKIFDRLSYFQKLEVQYKNLAYIQDEVNKALPVLESIVKDSTKDLGAIDQEIAFLREVANTRGEPSRNAFVEIAKQLSIQRQEIVRQISEVDAIAKNQNFISAEIAQLVALLKDFNSRLRAVSDAQVQELAAKDFFEEYSIQFEKVLRAKLQTAYAAQVFLRNSALELREIDLSQEILNAEANCKDAFYLLRRAGEHYPKFKYNRNNILLLIFGPEVRERNLRIVCKQTRFLADVFGIRAEPKYSFDREENTLEVKWNDPMFPNLMIAIEALKKAQ